MFARSRLNRDGIADYDKALVDLDYVTLQSIRYELIPEDEYLNPVLGTVKKDFYFVIDYDSESIKGKNPLQTFEDQFSSSDLCKHCNARNCRSHTGIILFPEESESRDGKKKQTSEQFSIYPGKRAMIIHPYYEAIVKKMLEMICTSCEDLIVDINADVTLKAKTQKILKMGDGAKLPALYDLLKSGNKTVECTRQHSTGRGDALICPAVNVYTTGGGGITAKIISKDASHTRKLREAQEDENEESLVSSSGSNKGTGKRGGLIRGARGKGGRLPAAQKKVVDADDTSKTQLRARTIYNKLISLDPYVYNLFGYTKEQIKAMFISLLPVPQARWFPRSKKNKSSSIAKIYGNCLKECAGYKPGSGKILDLERKLTALYKELLDEYGKIIASKAGWYRSKTGAKRPDNSFRTVITPYDGNYWETMISADIADSSVMSVTVTNSNRAELQELMFSGGILYINKVKGRNSWKTTLISNDNFANKGYHILQEGDIVWKKLQTGDTIISGRQPTNTLHNLYGSRVIVLPTRNVTGINIVITELVKGDFDGDSMHNHVLQTIEAREDAEKMLPSKNIRSAQKSKPATAPIYHAPVAATMMTIDQSVGISRELYLRCIQSYALAPHAQKRLDSLDERLEKHGIKYYSMKKRLDNAINNAKDDLYVVRKYINGSEIDRKEILKYRPDKALLLRGNEKFTQHTEDSLNEEMERIKAEIARLEDNKKNFMKVYIEGPLIRELNRKLITFRLDLNEYNKYLEMTDSDKESYVNVEPVSDKFDTLKSIEFKASKKVNLLNGELELLIKNEANIDIINDKEDELGIAVEQYQIAKNNVNDIIIEEVERRKDILETSRAEYNKLQNDIDEIKFDVLYNEKEVNILEKTLDNMYMDVKKLIWETYAERYSKLNRNTELLEKERNKLAKLVKELEADISDFPDPTVVRKYDYLVREYSGYELFSTLFPEDFDYDHPNGVKIRDGILISGIITKTTLGTGHGGIIDVMSMYYMPDWEKPANFINDATRMLNTFIDSWGFSVKYTDFLFAGYMGLNAKQAAKVDEIKREILKLRKPYTFEESIEYNKKVKSLVNSIKEVSVDKSIFTTADVLNRVIFSDTIPNYMRMNDDALKEIERLKKEYFDLDPTGELRKEVEAAENKQSKTDENIYEEDDSKRQMNRYGEYESESDDDIYEELEDQDDVVYKQRKEHEKKLSDYKKKRTVIIDAIRTTLSQKTIFFTDEMIDNGLLYMSDQISGAKGSAGNMTNISIGIGPQNLAGNPIPKTVTEGTRAIITARPRSLFPHNFVPSSYVVGLSPESGHIHSVTNRENVATVQTVTPIIGYLQRSLQTALENIKVINGTTEARDKVIYRPVSGDDGHSGLKQTFVKGEPQIMDVDYIMNKINLRYLNTRTRPLPFN